MTATMLALVADAPGRMSLVKYPTPSPGPGEVLVKPALVGLCGTDLEIADGNIDPAYVRYPLVIGHEWCGVVASAGSGVRAPMGSLVVVEGVVPCWQCARCREGLTNLCLYYDEIGFTRNGAAAGAIAAPASLVHVVEPSVSPEEAVLVEPAAVAYRALRRASPAPGQRVLVIGDGTVGLLGAHLARLWNPASIDVLGLRSEQETLAVRSGASAFTCDAEKLQGDYDLVFEAAGSPRAALLALGLARRGGVVALLGLSGHGQTADIALDDLVNRDITVFGSFSYTSQAFREVVQLLNAHAISPGFLVTQRYRIEYWADAIAQLRSREGLRGKVLLEIGTLEVG